MRIHSAFFAPHELSYIHIPARLEARRIYLGPNWKHIPRTVLQDQLQYKFIKMQLEGKTHSEIGRVNGPLLSRQIWTKRWLFCTKKYIIISQFF